MQAFPVRALWPTHPPSVLLVDRDSDTRRMYGEYLKFSACDVEEAEDGREALALAIAHHPDVLITETRLRGMDGFQLCSLLRSESSTRELPIIFVTGDGYSTDVQRAQESGADTVLIKPCLPETLFVEMRRLLSESSAIRDRSRKLSLKVGEQLARSAAVLDKSRQTFRRVTLSRAHQRYDTTEPPLAPPQLVCPSCDHPLLYVRSHLGGVSVHHSEQWDYYECGTGCGEFQYRQRTRKLRKVL